MDRKGHNEKSIIVSMTSYPARIQYVSSVLASILVQTKEPDDIILWLAEEQFPGGENDLPLELRKMIDDDRITLRWCEDDLKPHKKYFYAFQEYPDDLVITIDDDLCYPPDMIENLYASYLEHPNAVSAMRVHLMVYDEEVGILPYQLWVMSYKEAPGIESMQLFPTGVGGVLYPVSLFNREMLDKNAIEETCIYADDIWLKLMELVSDVPVVFVSGHSNLEYIEGTQKSALYKFNGTHNDEQLIKSIRWVEERYGEGFVMDKLIAAQNETKLLSIGMLSYYYYDLYIERIDHLKKLYYALENSPTFRAGKIITWPGRQIKNALKHFLPQNERKIGNGDR